MHVKAAVTGAQDMVGLSERRRSRSWRPGNAESLVRGATHLGEEAWCALEACRVA